MIRVQETQRVRTQGGSVAHRQMSPTLTIKAIQDTPALGNRVATAQFQVSPRSLTRKYGIKPADAERIVDPVLDIDTALYVITR